MAQTELKSMIKPGDFIQVPKYRSTVKFSTGRTPAGGDTLQDKDNSEERSSERFLHADIAHNP